MLKKVAGYISVCGFFCDKNLDCLFMFAIKPITVNVENFSNTMKCKIVRVS